MSTQGLLRKLTETWLPTSGSTFGQTLTYDKPKAGQRLVVEDIGYDVSGTTTYATGASFPQHVTVKLVYNDTGAAIAARRVVQWTDNSDEYGIGVQYPASSIDKTLLAGVTLVEIPNGYVGYVVCEGYTKCTSGAALTARAPLKTVTTTGKVDDAGPPAATEYIGRCHTAASGADEDVLCHIQL
jgi:hypothetical protein